MTQQEIIEMARQKADYWMNHYDRKSLSDMSLLYKDVESFVKLVAAKEREACAKVADEHGFYGVSVAQDIRARVEA